MTHGATRTGDANASRVLVVDDGAYDVARIRELVTTLDVTLQAVADAQTGWETMQQRAPDLLVLDEGLPNGGALKLLRRVRSDPRLLRTPLVLKTSETTDKALIEAAHECGAFLVGKPVQEGPLLNILRGALRVSGVQPIARIVHPLTEALRHGHFEFRTLTQAQDLAAELGWLCPDPQRVTLGLTELMVNAVEHGNLELGYAAKADLCRSHAWTDEVEKRLLLPRYRDRVAHVYVTASASWARFEIEDEGAGFAWARYLTFEHARALDPNGRGIALARHLSFSKLYYSPPGNRVTAEVDWGKDE